MNRKILCGALAAVMITGAGGFALAQDATPASAASTHMAQASGRTHMKHMNNRGDQHRDFRHGHGMRGHARGPGGAVISDLMQMQRLYMMQGKSHEMTALYQHVLTGTQDQEVRNFAYAQMARQQLRPANPDAAIATLRKSLDENLTALNKRHQQRTDKREKMGKSAN